MRLIEGVRFIRVCKTCTMFVNDKRSTVTLYCDKVPRVKEAKEAVLYFVQDFRFNPHAVF